MVVIIAANRNIKTGLATEDKKFLLIPDSLINKLKGDSIASIIISNIFMDIYLPS